MSSKIRTVYLDAPYVRFRSDQVRIVKTTTGKILFAGTNPTQEPSTTRGIQRDYLSGYGYEWYGAMYYEFPNYDNPTSEYQCWGVSKPYEIKFVDSRGNTPTSNTPYIEYTMRNAVTGNVYHTSTTYGEFLAHADMDDIQTTYGRVRIPITSNIVVPWNSTLLGSDRNVVVITTTFNLKPVFTYDVTDYVANNGRFWDISDYDENGGDIIVDDDIHDGIIVGSDTYD